jgi:cellulose synthase/poly-beta-1,6-N-acetylglucosamine synthase-like glycosyltransferase
MLMLVDILLLMVLGFFLLYLALLSVLALLAQPKRVVQPSRRRLFAVIVPAHNEQIVIEKALRSLRALDYPRELYEIILVADNCSDSTAEIGRTMSATLYEREDMSLRGKGHALRWCFDLLLASGKGYDACVVVDADTEVSRNMLTVMNRYLEEGAHVVQVADVVKPQPGVWNSEIIRLAFTLYNVVRPMGKKVIGCSAGLRGNGMCFSTETLRQVPWQAYSLTEDLEYGLMLPLHGVDVVFAPEATVVTTMPTEQRHSQTQRARWEMGRIPVIKKYGPLLLKAAVRQRSFKLFDAFVDIVMPPIVNMLLVVMAITVLHVAFVLLGNKDAIVLCWLWAAVFMLGMVHVLGGMFAVNADRSLYKALLYVPQYALWKIFLYLKLAIKGNPREWIRTTREHHNTPVPKSLLDGR